MNESLENWVDGQRLTRHETSLKEITELLAVADRDLSDCKEALSPDNRLVIAYNAALQCATAALAASGYRAGRTQHHHMTIQTLKHTLGLDAMLINQLQSFRKKRHQSDYERAGAVSDREADEMIQFAKFLRTETERWLRERYPHLLA